MLRTEQPSPESRATAARTDEPTGGVDVSHRGGPPGFVRVDGDVLTIPDFSGNRYFNTLGNLLGSPRAAVLFLDFAHGDLLHLQGTTEIRWDGSDVRALDARGVVLGILGLDDSLTVHTAFPSLVPGGAFTVGKEDGESGVVQRDAPDSRGPGV